MNNSLNKTARWSTLALAMGIMSTLSMQGYSAIYWPGGGDGDNTDEKSKEYKRGYKIGQEDCVAAPKDCKVMLEDVVAMPGWGETEPNDYREAADRLFLNRFYKANSLDQFDKDWYYIATTKPNQNLVISFLGDQADYMNTAGWTIRIHDRHGNVIAAFDSAANGEGNVYRTGDNEGDVVDPDKPVLAKTPLSLAKIMLATVGNPSRYYISVEPQEDGGANRGYHIAAMVSESDQLSPNPDTNFSDVETESNDTRETADPLTSNVHMFGVFGRKIVNFFVPPGPPEYEIGWFYINCDPLNISTMPKGQDNCECDTTNDPVDPRNPNFSLTPIGDPNGDYQVPNGYTYGNPGDTDSGLHPAFDDDPSMPGVQIPMYAVIENGTGADDDEFDLPPAAACEARRVQVPGTGTDTGTWFSAFDYDNDWFKFHSDGNEQLKFEMCAKGACDFARVHLKVVSDSLSTPLVNTPIQPGWTFDFGVLDPGTYYIELSPEPVDGGGNVDPNTGIHTVDDLTGPYNFVLRSTKLPPGGN